MEFRRFSSVVVMDFSGVYGPERFARAPGTARLDCTPLNGTDCYCDALGAAAIRRIIAPFPPDGIHFIDNGDHRYVTTPLKQSPCATPPASSGRTRTSSRVPPPS